MRPVLGQVSVLVYRECEHGCWCATGEGARAPRCPMHGLLMLPATGERRLGFAAWFGREQAMVASCRRLGPSAHVYSGDAGRYFHPDEVAGEDADGTP